MTTLYEDELDTDIRPLITWRVEYLLLTSYGLGGGCKPKARYQKFGYTTKIRRYLQSINYCESH